MTDSDGKFEPAKKTDRPCRECGKRSVTYKAWESNCGGYRDFKFKCKDCGHTWWIEGADS